nr:putative reverse transcriptase domain-containing protein [Tanacetum cinerariifolium]
MGVTRETGVISPTDLPILVLSSPGVPLRATLTQFALRVDADTQDSVVELLADKRPGLSGRVFAITEDQANKTSGTITGFLATIHDTTSEFPSIHDPLIISEFPDVFPDELPGIPLVREVEFNIELIPGVEPISKTPYRMAPIEL